MSNEHRARECRGKLVVISGPSGVGKSTVCDALTERAGIRRLVTCTTRPPRRGEVPGEHYRFLSEEEFVEGVEQGEFLEHAVVHGHHYGTPKEAAEEIVARGECALLAIDVQGAEQLRRQAEVGRGDSRTAELGRSLKTIFLVAPDDDTLRSRLVERATEDATNVALRLEAAKRETAEKDKYDHIVVNGDLDAAVEEILELLRD